MTDRTKHAQLAEGSKVEAGPQHAKKTTRSRHRLRLRNLRPEDYESMRSITGRVYASMGGQFGGAMSREKFESMLSRFPEGQIGIEDRGRIVAAALSLIVDYDRYGDAHSYGEITGDAYFTTHDPDGDVLYGAEVVVDPDYRSMRLGRRLYDARKELCKQLNLRAIIAGGRIPGYKDYADRMTPQQYVEAVRSKKAHDPVLSFQLSNDFHVRRVIRGYLPGDAASLDYATLIQWENMYYERRAKPVVGAQKESARIGVVQWRLRQVESVEDLLQQVEYFVESVADFKSDFAVFPELFDVALMGLVEQTDVAAAMRKIAEFTAQIVETMQGMAVRHNVNIVGASMPVVEGGKLFNEAYLFRRDGTRETQRKIHITPVEKRLWGLEGGNVLRHFRTDAGTVGILICYDVEFPELGRVLADRGVQILFVPSWTETKNGYQRVRRCAQARAIENECYVILSGSVGNLPRVENVNIHYSQSAIFSPSDFAFPHDAVVAESTPDTETVLVADVDLEKLRRLRDEGSVRTFRDRRLDLYRVEWLGPISE
jgi:predicted amidohydrolase/GNAT superfamily N-acetyltransferase